MRYVVHTYWQDKFPGDVVDLNPLDNVALINAGLLTPVLDPEQMEFDYAAEEVTDAPEPDTASRLGSDGDDVPESSA